MEVCMDGVNLQELECLQEAIYHEARGESFAGQIYVGFVIKNRVKSSRYPNTFCEVIKQPWQFSYNHEINSFEMRDNAAAKRSKDIAYTVLVTPQEYSPIPSYVLYYHADHITPNWDYSKIWEYAYIDNHKFFAEH